MVRLPREGGISGLRETGLQPALGPAGVVWLALGQSCPAGADFVGNPRMQQLWPHPVKPARGRATCMRVRAVAGLAVVLVLALLSSGVPVLANHVQSSGGKSVAFDHVTGNEWWVEVGLSGTDASTVSAVEAQDTNGPWVALAKKSWGPYAASFHIEPGNTVRFRATFPGGAQVVSCLFTHPAGVEQCGPTSTT